MDEQEADLPPCPRGGAVGLRAGLESAEIMLSHGAVLMSCSGLGGSKLYSFSVDRSNFR